jgi:hypothetical protein
MSHELREKLLTDSYYLNYLKDSDLIIVNRRLEAFLSSKTWGKNIPIHKSLKIHVALRVKFIATNIRGSCRWLAEICFPKQDNRHGIQMDGRDIKRWAAVALGEVFDESALLKDEGDYWHEY